MVVKFRIAPPPPSQTDPRDLPTPLKYLPPKTPMSRFSQIGQYTNYHIPKPIIENIRFQRPKGHLPPPPVVGGPPQYAQTTAPSPIIRPKALGAPSVHGPLTWRDADMEWLLRHKPQYEKTRQMILNREKQVPVGSKYSFESQPVFSSQVPLPVYNKGDMKPPSVPRGVVIRK